MIKLIKIYNIKYLKDAKRAMRVELYADTASEIAAIGNSGEKVEGLNANIAIDFGSAVVIPNLGRFILKSNKTWEVDISMGGPKQPPIIPTSPEEDWTDTTEVTDSTDTGDEPNIDYDVDWDKDLELEGEGDSITSDVDVDGDLEVDGGLDTDMDDIDFSTEW